MSHEASWTEEQDVQSAIQFLEAKGYKVKHSHNAVWQIGAHGYIQSESIAAITHVLKTVGLFVLDAVGRMWIPRFMLTDDSSAEEGAIDDAFNEIMNDTTATAELRLRRREEVETRGISSAFAGINGESNPTTVLKCVVHTGRTFQKRFPVGTPAYGSLVNAMYSTTKIGCEERLAEAFLSLSEDAKKRNETWFTRRLMASKQWGMWSRQHIPLLLQIKSTNSVEGFHKDLKHTPGKMKLGQKNSMIEVLRRCVEFSEKQSQRSDGRAFDRISKAFKETQIYPFLKSLPECLQKEEIKQLKQAKIYFDNGRLDKQQENLSCDCDHYKTFMLPCYHMFLGDLDGGLFTDEYLDNIILQFEEN
ncbi:hypothetical protein HDV05_000704, partial [Chytridiales sp. JEL 0842]